MCEEEFHGGVGSTLISDMDKARTAADMSAKHAVYITCHHDNDDMYMYFATHVSNMRAVMQSHPPWWEL